MKIWFQVFLMDLGGLGLSLLIILRKKVWGGGGGEGLIESILCHVDGSEQYCCKCLYISIATIVLLSPIDVAIGLAIVYVTHHAKKDLMGIAKNIDPVQPAQSVQADHGLVQIFRRIHAYLSFHIYLSDILHFSFLMHVTSKRGPYSFM